jgi:peptidyl-prolyl cis-trans isomerase B (cyclophilin B)
MHKFMKNFLLLILFLLLFISSNGQPPAKKTNIRPPAKPVAAKKAGEPFEKATALEMVNQCAKMETDLGNIELEFFPEFAPETVRNFLNLISLKAFDNTTFSRVVPNFVIQGGNPGTRKPLVEPIFSRMLKKIPDEPSIIKHERGILSMARTDEPNSASSSFFILIREAPHLDNKFAAFGKVINGMETVDLINKEKVVNEKPDKPIVVKKASLFPCVNETTRETK